MNKKINRLSILAAGMAIISSLTGIFYTTGGSPRTVENIYGQEVILYGDGIYANDALLKAGTAKGTDIVILAVSVLLIGVTIFTARNKVYELLQAGILSVLLYDAACVIMGQSFNRLYPVYLIWFSASLFAFIFAMTKLCKGAYFSNETGAPKRGTAVFLMVGGCSVLIWLTYIIPAIMSGVPTEFIDIYTTEPTFTIDLGILFPMCVATGIGLLQKKKYAYPVASVLMTFITCVGICVIFQTVVQLRMGIVLSIGQIMGLVVSFVILGTIAVVLNARLLRSVISKNISCNS